MSTTNNAVLQGMDNVNICAIQDDMVAGPASAQATAALCRSQLCRVVTAVANGSLVLPSILNGEVSWPIVVVNDSPNTILVGGSPGEKVNGVATTTNFSAGTLSIAAGASGIFFPVPAMFKNQGGALGGTLDWRSAAIS